MDDRQDFARLRKIPIALPRGKQMLQASLDQQQHETGRSTTQSLETAVNYGLDQTHLHRVQTKDGSAIFSSKNITMGDFIVEIAGEMLSDEDGELRERHYKKKTIPSDMFYILHEKKKLCIDVTTSPHRLGRYANICVEDGNAMLRKVVLHNIPRIILFATRNILSGEEINYTTENWWWRKETQQTESDTENGASDDDENSNPFDLSRDDCTSIISGDVSSIDLNIGSTKGEDRTNKNTSDSCQLEVHIQDDCVSAFSDFPDISSAPISITGLMSLIPMDAHMQDVCGSDPAIQLVSGNSTAVSADVSVCPPSDGDDAEAQTVISDLTALCPMDTHMQDVSGYTPIRLVSGNSTAVSADVSVCPPSDGDDAEAQTVISDLTALCPMDTHMQDVSGYTPIRLFSDLTTLQTPSTSRPETEINSAPSVTQDGIMIQQTSCSSMLSAETDDSCVIAPHSLETSGKKKRQQRPCPYCGNFQSRLTRHLMRKHSKVSEVQMAAKVPKKQRDRAFKKMRKEGIYLHNKVQIRNNNLVLESERKQQTQADLVICSQCRGFYNKNQIWRHKSSCKGETTTQTMPLSSVRFESAKINDNFRDSILSKFHHDQIGNLCQTDATILLVGERLYEKLKRKKDKAVEVRKSVMTDMRRIAQLYTEFLHCSTVTPEKNGNAGDMLRRKNFYVLEKAIENYTEPDAGKVKAGLKLALYYLIKKVGKIIKGSYLILDKDDDAAEVDKFLEVLHLHQDAIFGNATYILNENRQRNLRKPNSLPQDEDVVKLRNYSVDALRSSVETIKAIIQGRNKVEKFVSHLVGLRDLTVSRLTLFNFRRGGEPARMTITEWEEAKDDVWINHDSQIVKQQYGTNNTAIKPMKIAYQTGKGNDHLVPIQIPTDTIPAMELLADQTTRDAAGINNANVYMFPSIQNSMSHVSGWHAIHRVCIDAQISDPEKITATKIRHRASTIYAKMDVPEGQRLHFYRHMGHSKEINENVYQAPPAEAELNIVGPYLQLLDEGHITTPAKSASSTYSTYTSISPGHITTPAKSASSTYSTCTSNSISPECKKERQYTKWSAEHTTLVTSYFDKWIIKDRLPGKDDIIAFKQLHPGIHHSWRLIKTKVFNESRAQKTRLKKLNSMML